MENGASFLREIVVAPLTNTFTVFWSFMPSSLVLLGLGWTNSDEYARIIVLGTFLGGLDDE